MDGDFTWLGIAIAIGSMLSLAYYLRVIAAVWMGGATAPVPALAGGSPEADVMSPRAAPWPRATVETIAIAAASLGRRHRLLRDHPGPAARRRSGRRPRALGLG